MTGPSCSEPVTKTKRLCSYLGFPSLTDCLLPKLYNCLNNCNERGTCFNGFCHCSEGAVTLRRGPLRLPVIAPGRLAPGKGTWPHSLCADRLLETPYTGLTYGLEFSCS